MEPILAIALLACLCLIWSRRGRLRGWNGSGQSLRSVLAPNRCHWVADSDRDTGGTLRQFHCTTCGVTAYSTNKSGPRQCKKGLDGAKL